MPRRRRPALQPLSPADRLRQALATLTATSGSDERVTVSALCQLANVSRNSLYRYHRDVLGALREHQRVRHGAGSARPHNTIDSRHAELAALRLQIPKLAALVDHYYAAYRETRALLDRRDRQLAELRRRLNSAPVLVRHR